VQEWQEHPWVTEGRRRVRFGVGVTARAAQVDGAARLAFAQAVDDLGFDSIWVPDHPVFTTDCWIALAAYAAVTRRVRLGPLVSCSLYRSAAMTARLASDVDRLSGGRAVVGLGAGWLELEFHLLGLSLPDPREQMAALTRTLAALPHYWTGPPIEVDFVTGATAGEALWWPPVQRPRVPILVGGSGERVTLRLVAQYADMCNFEDRFAQTPEDVRRKLATLAQHCAVLERPYESIIKSYFVNGVVLAPSPERVAAKIGALPPLMKNASQRYICTPAEFVDRIQPIMAEGIDYLIVNLTGFEDIETLELLATHVAPALQVAAPA
jgi:alkanesulfonate monooxygenase SsuD/methylene tetrahydromethanopterin reductase-like flavin-dependent oxidoreductase (luciferase family)